MDINSIKVELPNSAKVNFQALLGREGLSEVFEYVVEVLGAEHWLDPQALLGKTMAVVVPYSHGGERFFHGHIARVEHAGRQGRHYVDRLTMRPWLWFLEHHVDCKVFQKKSVPDIVKAVLREHPVAVHHFGQRGSYPELEYCIQYRESDRVFVDRLLESAGMYYYFKHSANEHQMVLCDAESTHEAAAHYREVPFLPHGHRNRVTSEFIDALGLASQVQPGVAALGDYNFETPRVNLKVDHRRQAGHTQGNHEVFEWPGGYGTPEAGRGVAGKRSGIHASEAKRYSGVGTARGLAAGHTVALEHAPEFVGSGQSSLLVVSTQIRIQQPAREQQREDNELFRCEFTAVPAGRAFHPPIRTPKPAMPAAQSAVVVGPSGQEIHTDKYGRVKIQFHWDRVGGSNEQSSCFVRVAQPWGGSGYGAQFLPRIGQEVIVSFLDGEPDRPLVTGRIHNADQMPPYPLPDNATVSTLKTHSSPNGESGNFNELRFEDKKGSEYVWLQAEKDFHRRVEHDSTDQVGQDALADIKRDRKDKVEQDWHLTLGRDLMHKVGGDFHLQSATDMIVKAGSHYSLKSGQDLTAEGGTTLSLKATTEMHQKAGENLNAEAGVNVHIKAGAMLVLEAGSMLTVKAGPSFIVLSESGVDIFGPEVNINSGGAAGSGPGANPVATSDPKEPTEPEIPDDPLSSSGGAARMPGGRARSGAVSVRRPEHLGGESGKIKAGSHSSGLSLQALGAAGMSAGQAAARAVQEGRIPLTPDQLKAQALREAGSLGRSALLEPGKIADELQSRGIMEVGHSGVDLNDVLGSKPTAGSYVTEGVESVVPVPGAPGAPGMPGPGQSSLATPAAAPGQAAGAGQAGGAGPASGTVAAGSAGTAPASGAASSPGASGSLAPLDPAALADLEKLAQIRRELEAGSDGGGPAGPASASASAEGKPFLPPKDKS